MRFWILLLALVGTSLAYRITVEDGEEAGECLDDLIEEAVAEALEGSDSLEDFDDMDDMDDLDDLEDLADLADLADLDLGDDDLGDDDDDFLDAATDSVMAEDALAAGLRVMSGVMAENNEAEKSKVLLQAAEIIEEKLAGILKEVEADTGEDLKDLEAAEAEANAALLEEGKELAKDQKAMDEELKKAEEEIAKVEETPEASETTTPSS